MKNPPTFDFAILYVENPTESSEFYRRILGIDPIQSSPAFVLFSFANDVKFGLWLRSEAEPAVISKPGASEICFHEENIDQLYDQWAKQGVTMTQKPTDMDFGRSFVALDPDGHRIRIYKYYDR